MGFPVTLQQGSPQLVAKDLLKVSLKAPSGVARKSGSFIRSFRWSYGPTGTKIIEDASGIPGKLPLKGEQTGFLMSHLRALSAGAMPILAPRSPKGLYGLR